jgi:hypothetical protein
MGLSPPHIVLSDPRLWLRGHGGVEATGDVEIFRLVNGGRGGDDDGEEGGLEDDDEPKEVHCRDGVGVRVSSVVIRTVV